MKVYGSLISTATQRVLACLYEKDLSFEFVVVDMRAESRAITQHIADVYEEKGTNLIFTRDPKKLTLATWTEVETQKFDQHASKLAFQHYYKHMFGMGPPNEAIVSELEGEVTKVLDVYEARLARQKYLSGEGFGLADLHHLPVLNILMNSPPIAKKLFESLSWF